MAAFAVLPPAGYNAPAILALLQSGSLNPSYTPAGCVDNSTAAALAVAGGGTVVPNTTSDPTAPPCNFIQWPGGTWTNAGYLAMLGRTATQAQVQQVLDGGNAPASDGQMPGEYQQQPGSFTGGPILTFPGGGQTTGGGSQVTPASQTTPPVPVSPAAPASWFTDVSQWVASPASSWEGIPNWALAAAAALLVYLAVK